MPKISVLVPAYNGELYLKQALDSALQQTFRDFEIIIIDDGSTDKTGEIAIAYQKDHPQEIRYIYQKNQGLACARNTGLKVAQGSFIALLDCDDIWLPQRLASGVKAFENDPNVGLVHGNITRIDDHGAIIDTAQRDARYLSGDMFQNIFLRRADVSCPTVLFRKECCEQVGVFDENLTRLGCEDRELWLRIAKIAKVVYVPEVLAYYRVTASSMSRNKDKMLKARLYVIDKFFPAEGTDQRLRRQALSKIYRDLGDENLLTRAFPRARQEYAQAISYDPFSLWPWINYFKALFKVSH